MGGSQSPVFPPQSEEKVQVELTQTTASLSAAQDEMDRLRQELKTSLEEAATALEEERRRSTEMEAEANASKRSEEATSADLQSQLQAQAEQV